jgi:hypothetical protein
MTDRLGQVEETGHWVERMGEVTSKFGGRKLRVAN